MALINKEGIRDQMLKTAARVWGVQEDDIENNFDPLILFLIEACAAELEKINDDITASQSRLIDYLAGVLLPEALFGASPASGIISALPLETSTIADAGSSFFLTQSIQKKGSNKTETTELYFTPIGSFTLLKSELAYIVCGNKLFRTRENSQKELAYTSDFAAISNEIWLAIKPDPALKSLAGLHIYFDLRNNSGAHNFYNNLPYAKCYLNEDLIEIEGGFGGDVKCGLNPEETLLSGNDQTSKTNRKVGFIYQKQFIKLGKNAALSSKGVPEKLQQQLSKELIKQLETEQLVFLKFEFPQYFQQQVLDSVSCSINAFPVVNKKLKTFAYRTDDWLNIIPLPVEGVYLDLASIRTEGDEYYKVRPSAGAQSLVAGEAIVRSSGVGKTSSNEVREMISSITEKIRDQSAYFGQLSNEYILERLRDIGKTLAGLEDHMVAATDKKTDYNYLMLRPKNNGEIVTIDYWITNGEDANQVKAGVQLSASHQSKISSKKAFTVTGFSGGRNRVVATEKKNLLQQQLISRGKVVSAEDVELLCFQLFGDKLKSVEVKKSVLVSSQPGEGFRRSIDVLITYSDKVNTSTKNEADYLCRELAFLLESNASPVYPYRVIVTNNV
ncbi:MAG: hypothetical protein JWP81_3412 [Ferruginibacter sp.]|nr:hypothetical protein [Ferruginibacter sp.]